MLKILCRGLQASVTRLLEDLSKATQPTISNGTVSRYMLRKVDNILSQQTGQVLASTENNDGQQSPVSYHLSDVMDSFSCSLENNSYHSALNDSFQSSSKSPVLSVIHTSSDRNEKCSNTNECNINPITCSLGNALPHVQVPAIPTPSSSLYSVTSMDENNFNHGLASLDANIQRLQERLKHARSLR